MGRPKISDIIEGQGGVGQLVLMTEAIGQGGQEFPERGSSKKKLMGFEGCRRVRRGEKGIPGKKRRPRKGKKVSKETWRVPKNENV